jgi:MoaA/NifB/PqqE/SkfB family radical SAM enzyme
MNQAFKRGLLRIPGVRQYAIARRKRVGGLLYRIETVVLEALSPSAHASAVAAAGVEMSVMSKWTHRITEHIRSEKPLNGEPMLKFCASLEEDLTARKADPLEAHREIGRALFERDPNLYNTATLPAALKRFTYPGFLSIHLNEHCNAACFFCREADFKGRLLDFDQLHKLDSGLRMARVIELTGWGEPFFYPKLKEVVDKCFALNDSPALLSFTTNGSMLSADWGKKMAGRIHRLCISINAATPETYKTQMRYKNKKFTFDYVIDHVREFVAELQEEDIKRLAFHMVASTDNFREIPALVVLSSELRIPTITIGNYFCANEDYLDKTLVGVKDEYNAIIEEAVLLGYKRGVEVHARRFYSNEKTTMAQDTCFAPFERLYAEVPGDIAPCCFMGASRMGNIYDAGVEAVWFSSQMQALRRSRHLPECSTCTLYNPFDDDVTHLSPYLIEARIKQRKNDIYSINA